MTPKKPGRPPISADGRTVQVTLTILPEDYKALLAINPKISRAIRQVLKERKEQDNAHHE